MAVRFEIAGLVRAPFRIGEWLVEPSLNRLSHGDTTIQLELKMMDVLVCLAERPGEVVQRQEIVDRVWSMEFVSDNTLNHAIAEIRSALGDDARNPSFIETIHRRGYRLVSPVEPAVCDGANGFRAEKLPVHERRETFEDEHRPYPGLAAFTERDTEFFFGREAEVAQMWRKLTSRRMVALIGPSGVGKSSFLLAGVIPAKPDDWGVAVCHPGEAPFAALIRALVPEFAGDLDAISKLVHLSEPGETVAMVSRWRERHDKALLVIDQFEELFTLNSPEVHERFAQLLRQLVEEADIHVLLAMRDDFLHRCHAHEGLRPIFEDLEVLDQPDAEALRRAVVEPAKRLGFAFADVRLPQEMVTEVEGERGALPMLAFAVARLWEKRDRAKRLLTRQTYEEAGGVGGALARHAEATLAAIGDEHLPVVRELFRNLVTAEGTRAAREADDLLSVIPEPNREHAQEVLRRLIDARLLTSFEENGAAGKGRRRLVEVVHESLLTSWPRLVRWQTRDADAAQIRDQLRQAARTWDGHGRTNDFLWSGHAYREFAVWRESYPGNLTEREAEFVREMTSFSNRRRRFRRTLAAASILAAVALAIVFGTLWRRGIRETRRAEAQELLALGHLELQTDPTAALAFARAGLDALDSREGRLFALKAMASGPIARLLPMRPELGVVHSAVFNRDGEWVALEGYEKLKVYRRSGGPPVMVDAFPSNGWASIWPFFDPSGRRLCAQQMGEIRTYAIPDFSEVARHRIDPFPFATVPSDRGGVMFLSDVGETQTVELWRFDSTRELVAKPRPLAAAAIDAAGEWLAIVSKEEDRNVYLKSLVKPALPTRLCRSHDEPVSDLLLHPKAEWIALRGRDSDRITVWPLDGEPTGPLRSFDGRALEHLAVDRRGTRIVVAGILDGIATVTVRDLGLPAETDPLVMRSRFGTQGLTGVTVDPSGRWLVASLISVAAFWPLPEDFELVFPSSAGSVYSLAFTPDGRTLAIPSFGSGGLRLQPIMGGGEQRQLTKSRPHADLEMDPLGRFAVVSETLSPVVSVLPLDGTEPIGLEGFDTSTIVGPVAYDPQRELVAAAALRGPAGEKVIRVWNLDSRSMRVLGPLEDAGDGFEGGITGLEFLPDGGLLSSGENGVRRWWPADGSSELLFAGRCAAMDVAPDGRTAIVGCYGPGGNEDALFLDLTKGEVLPLVGFQGSIAGGTFSQDGNLVAVGTSDGAIQVGRLSGGEPHILFGHDSMVTALAFSPDGKQLASADRGGTVRVWPVPDVSKPPLHTLPLDELTAKLDTITNLSAVRDKDSATGWRLKAGPFSGWQTTPQ
jgi:DNA-binding winged helix-turn-helix (wHTH) protein/WD40 repeat protein